jgi:hypothetical protein
MSKLFEEALADAKKLKQVAEENAKKAILESITPKIKEFIDQQIIEQSNVQEDKTCEECGSKLYEGESHACEASHVNLDEDSIASLMEMLGVNKTITKNRVKKTLDKMSHQQISNLNEAAKKANSDDKLQSNEINKQYKNLFEEISMNKERYYEVDLQALREAVEQQADDLHAESELKKEMEHMQMEGEESEDSSSEGSAHEESEEKSSDPLEEMLQEIKLALDLGEEIEEDMLPEELRALLLPEDEDEESLDDDEDSDELPPLEDMEGEESEEDEEDDELPPLEEVFEIDPNMLREELANIRRSLSEGKVDHHFGGKAGGSAGVDGSFGGKGNKRTGVKNSFGGGSEGQDPFVNPPQINKLNEAIRKLSRKNRAQQEKLNKYRGAVQTLREQLEDLNLFNAKLLYVNKLLQNKSLNESQKKSIIRALDEAKSLGETKSLYKSLTESLANSTKKSTLSESTRFGSSSRTTTSASSQGTKTVGESDRWAKLAGLK